MAEHYFVKQYSIANRLAATISLVVASVTLLAATLFYISIGIQTESDLNGKADEMIGYIAGALAIPIWDLNIDTVEMIGDVFSSNDLVASLMITERRTGTVLYSITKESYNQDIDNSEISRIREIVYKEESIGQVKLILTKYSLHKKQNEILHFLIIATAIITLTVTLVTGFLIRRFLRTPLQKLNAIVNNYEETEYDRWDTTLPYLEFRPFGKVLAHMGRVIQDQMAALRKSEEKFRVVFERSPIGIMLLDSRSVVVDCNRHFAEIFGVQREQYYGINILERLPEGDMRNSLAAAISDSKALNYEGPYVSVLSGKRVHVSVSIERVTPDLLIIITLDITKRIEAEKKIIRLNSELEERVAERTAQLQASNRELESFCYSVSHDLRTPLRGIDGWSLALAEDFEPILDEQGRKYIDRIRVETQRMGQLIDDLLKLAQISRYEMERSAVNISEAADRVADMLHEREPERTGSFIIQPGLTTYGDAGMIEILLTNLLDNAWKFTEKTPAPRIEFGKLATTDPQRPVQKTGTTGPQIRLSADHPRKMQPQAAVEHDGNQIFFVKDNGAGFDMSHSSKLFGAFQRLHKSNEFPGTGIGLATVKRIIHRHGGEVWAEGAVNQGATFYFTLQG